MRGELFTFEGIDGSGKSTHIQMLVSRFVSLGIPVFVSKAIKTEDEKQLIISLMKTFSFPKNSLATMFLFQALHSKQYEEAKKALEEGKIVLADRWNASFWVYHQNFGILKEKPEILKLLDDLAFQGLIPTITFLLDLPVEVALERKRLQQPQLVDVFEQEDIETYRKARKAYLEMANSNPGWVVIDTTKPIIEVHQKIWEVVARKINLF
jgi:dTMP kinase